MVLRRSLPRGPPESVPGIREDDTNRPASGSQNTELSSLEGKFLLAATTAFLLSSSFNVDSLAGDDMYIGLK